MYDICEENKIWHLLLIYALTWSDKEMKQSVSRAIRKVFITSSAITIFKCRAFKEIGYTKKVVLVSPIYDVMLYLLSKISFIKRKKDCERVFLCIKITQERLLISLNYENEWS